MFVHFEFRDVKSVEVREVTKWYKILNLISTVRDRSLASWAINNY